MPSTSLVTQTPESLRGTLRTGLPVATTASAVAPVNATAAAVTVANAFDAASPHHTVLGWVRVIRSLWSGGR